MTARHGAPIRACFLRRDVNSKEVTPVTEVVEIDCIHWLSPSYAMDEDVDVPHWVFDQDGENE